MKFQKETLKSSSRLPRLPEDDLRKLLTRHGNFLNSSEWDSEIGRLQNELYQTNPHLVKAIETIVSNWSDQSIRELLFYIAVSTIRLLEIAATSEMLIGTQWQDDELPGKATL